MLREIHHSTLRLDALVDRIHAAHTPLGEQEPADGQPAAAPPPHPLPRSLLRAFIFEVRVLPHLPAALPPGGLGHAAEAPACIPQAAEYEDVGRCQLIWTTRPHYARRYGLPAHPAPEVQRLLAAAAARLTHRRQPGACPCARAKGSPGPQAGLAAVFL